MAKAGVHRQSMDTLVDALGPAVGARAHTPLPLTNLAHALIEIEVIQAAGVRNHADGRAGQTSAHGCQAGQPAGEAGAAPWGTKGKGMLDGHGGLLKVIG